MGSLYSRSTTFSVLIRVLDMDLEDSGHCIKLLCAPSRIGIENNEKVDILAKFTCRFITRSINKIPFSDMIGGIFIKFLETLGVTNGRRIHRRSDGINEFVPTSFNFLGFSIQIFPGFTFLLFPGLGLITIAFPYMHINII